MKRKKIYLVLLLFWIITFIFYLVGGEELKSKSYNDIVEMGDTPVGELVVGNVLEQEFYSQCDVINAISVYTATYDRVNSGYIYIRLLNENYKIITEKLVNIIEIPNNMLYKFSLDEALYNVKGKKFTLQIESKDGTAENAITCWYSSINKIDNGKLSINGNSVEGSLSMSVEGRINYITAPYYWHISLTIFLLLIAYIFLLIYMKKNNKKSMVLSLLYDVKKYKFLIKQLVSREFKTKYKRSALGMLWSILNPMLTMSIQYVVFSTIFKSDIPNYPVYLLSGIVLFSFFSEAITNSLQSIVNNASLITKVYVPKYIYPITKIFSSCINLFISMIPLLVVIIFTNTKITKAILLLPFGLLCLIIFCIGLGLALASAMVFFRDTSFLWGVVTMLWMYSTPIFYPEKIIPDNFKFIFKYNPLYHYFQFIRTIIINGVSPEPKEYIVCLVCSVLSLVIGGYIFKKSQNKFVLYI